MVSKAFAFTVRVTPPTHIHIRTGRKAPKTTFALYNFLHLLLLFFLLSAFFPSLTLDAYPPSPFPFTAPAPLPLQSHAARPPRRPRLFGGALDLSQAPGAGREGHGGANCTIHFGQRGEDRRAEGGWEGGREDGEG